MIYFITEEILQNKLINYTDGLPDGVYGINSPIYDPIESPIESPISNGGVI